MSTLRTRLIVSLLALALGSLATWAGDAYRGNALIRTDATDRIVVVLDADDDGMADEVFLFNPHRRLPAAIAPFTKPVSIRTFDDALALDADDGSFALRLTTALPRQGEPSVRTTGTTTDAHGIALARHSLPAEPGSEPQHLAEVDTDALVSVVYSTPPCGDNDYGCSAGGEGATGCSAGCPTGGGFSVGISLTLAAGNIGVTKEVTAACNVSCGSGFYACCACDKGAGSGGMSGTPKCACKSTSALQPCPSK